MSFQGTGSTLGSSSSRSLTPQEQLEVRRQNHPKRKAGADDLGGNHDNQDDFIVIYKRPDKGKCKALPTSDFGDHANAFYSDLDMLLDGLGLDEGLKLAAKNDPQLRNDLLAQLVPTNPRQAPEQSLEEIDYAPAAPSFDAIPDEIYNVMFGPPRPPLPFTFRDGALRMTRTAGRRAADTANCISLEELIDKDYLEACCCFAFFIGQQDFFRYLPTRTDAQLYVGRDVNMEPVAAQVLQGHGEVLKQNPKSKISSRQLDKIRPSLREVYRSQFGENFHVFYPYCGGCAHSKILLLIYPSFLRLVITSCNFLSIDLSEGDNHWYIHDLPRYASEKRLEVATSFEKLLTVHLRELAVPSTFLDMHFSGRFDFSRVKVQLVTSKPGSSRGLLAEGHGLLRLRRIVADMEERSEMVKNGVHLEYCSGSVGHLNDKWLKEFYDCAIGRKFVSLAKMDCDIPPCSVVFPTYRDVDACDELARTVASKNIGCHMNWGNAREEIQRIFRHYLSKDRGKLFHMKLLLALDPTNEKALPYYVYIGSANFSKGAWGRLNKAPAGEKDDPARGLRVEDCANYECGVIIPRSLLMTLLEKGSDWQDIVPYQRPAVPYEFSLETSDGSHRPFLKNPNEA